MRYTEKYFRLKMMFITIITYKIFKHEKKNSGLNMHLLSDLLTPCSWGIKG